MAFAATSAFAQRRPLSFAIGFGGIKTIAADAFVQRYMEGAETFDKKRLLVFLSFGFFQVGFVQYNVYVNLFARLFPAGAGFAAAPIRSKLADRQGLQNLVKQAAPCCTSGHVQCWQSTMQRMCTVAAIPAPCLQCACSVHCAVYIVPCTVYSVYTARLLWQVFIDQCVYHPCCGRVKYSPLGHLPLQ